MNQNVRASQFGALHAPGNPLILYNIWDAGSAAAVERAGARALATGSHSLAAAQGYDDGEAIPLDLLVVIVSRICACTTLPVSVDLEGGYAVAPEAVADNVRAVIGAGAVGINFEDQVVGGKGLHPANAQAERIAAIRASADHAGVDLFINARTDLFLQSPADEHPVLVDEAIARATAYTEAGASGFFVPGLTDERSIARLCKQVTLPVNVMMSPSLPPVAQLSDLGVRRISFGPQPWRDAMRAISAAAALHCRQPGERLQPDSS